MASFRVVDPFQSYRDSNGNPAEGGYFLFYDAGTTDPKAVYADPDLVTSNGSQIDLDAEGRIVAEAWGDGSYRVRLYQSDGTLIAEADNVEAPGGSAAQIPALVDGQWLTNNGAVLQWAPILQLPDPTGQDGKMVVADGAGYILTEVPEPEPPAEPDIVVDTASFQAGIASDPTKYYVQTGTGSAPASGNRNTQVSVTFPEAFGALWHVSVTQTHNGVTSNGFIPAQSNTAQSETGFTVRFTTDENSTANDWNIIDDVPFTWMAVGTREVP